MAMLLALLPMQSIAATTLQGDTDESGTVDVTLTISEGIDNFYTTKEGYQLVKESLSVPYFDLALYGLDQYYYNPDCYASGYQTAGTKDVANGVVTVMHVFIYATERFMMGYDPNECGKGDCDISPYISWTQGVGSTFMKFWNGSTNLNYYVNYQYPLGRPGWGSTSDQIALTDGDAIDIHLIQDGHVSGSQYSFFELANGKRDAAKVNKGESLTLTLNKTTSSYGTITLYSPAKNNAVYYIDEDEYDGSNVTAWKTLGNTNDDGKITIPGTLNVGTYLISCKGVVDGTGERGPAAFRLTVKEKVDLQYGDVNEDGTITSYDASMVLQYCAETGNTEEMVIGAADVDGDGNITAYDASLILRRSAGLITEFPQD